MSDEKIVQNEKDIFNSNVKSFKEREAELQKIAETEKEFQKRQKNSPFKKFLQVNKETYKLEDKLMQKNPLAYRVFRFLANNMDHYNAVMVSYSVMEEIFEVSRMTLYRAIKLLKEMNFICIYKSGSSNIYALNDNIVWNSWGTNKKYSKFQASVIIGKNEQTEDIQKKLKTKKHKELKLGDDNDK